ncbi:hypothetical protein JCM5353_001868 [Sporobolomyces roseus]
MIREVLPSRFSSKLPTFTSLPSSSLADSHGSSPSSSSSSSSSTFIGTPPWASTTSASDSSDDELETPPASPNSSTVSLPSDRKGKGKLPLDALLTYPFSINEICEDEDARGPCFDWTSPSVPSPPSKLPQLISSTSPSLDDALHLPPPVVPAAPSKPPRPTRQQEERLRGRTRSPRLLWRSELDAPSMKILDTYHDKTVGGRLPLLQNGMSKKEVKEWSLKVENAGI